MPSPQYQIETRWVNHPNRPVRYIATLMTKEQADARALELNEEYGTIIEYRVIPAGVSK